MPPEGTGQLVLYRTADGQTRIDVRLIRDSVWLTLNQIADLFQRDKSVISKHIKNIFEFGELDPARTVAKFATVQIEGGRSVTREIEFYRLEVILAVGYRVRSTRGTQFRQWATTQLEQYLVKGFAMDDERLKQGGGDYFDELLARIRDIRSSERLFWRKVLDIYATSVDYDPSAEASQKFFAVVQNKMHWAAHGHTAAEVIARRADSTKPNMGLTTWTGSRPRRTDVGFAKNYLTHQEIETLNLIVSAYLDFAELQARSRKPMTMREWIAKLDDFLRLSDRELLAHAGTISHDAALAKAQSEYDKFRANEDAKPQPVDVHFENALEQAKQIEAAKSKRKPKVRAE
ncbi:MAG: virulence RhuM family protein [Acidobacteriia bacterium]|nr:virulence RhuM family protein [Terriglobia bacterium]